MKKFTSILLFLFFSFCSNSFCQTRVKINLQDIGLLLPTTADLKSGDREFGRGPFVTCRVSLHLQGSQILADVYLKMAETEPDYTTIEKTWTNIQVYQEPEGRYIEKINLTSDISETNYRGVDEGFQIIGGSSGA
jgi:hypothetical protein